MLPLSPPVSHFHTVSLTRLCVLCDAAALQAPPWRDSGATQLREKQGGCWEKAMAVGGEGGGWGCGGKGGAWCW